MKSYRDVVWMVKRAADYESDPDLELVSRIGDEKDGDIRRLADEKDKLHGTVDWYANAAKTAPYWYRRSLLTGAGLASPIFYRLDKGPVIDKDGRPGRKHWNYVQVPGISTYLQQRAFARRQAAKFNGPPPKMYSPGARRLLRWWWGQTAQTPLSNLFPIGNDLDESSYTSVD